MKLNEVAAKKIRGRPLNVFKKHVLPQIAEKLGQTTRNLVEVLPYDLGGSKEDDELCKVLSKKSKDAKTTHRFELSFAALDEDGYVEGDSTWVVEIKSTDITFADIYLNEGGGGPSATGSYVLMKADKKNLRT